MSSDKDADLIALISIACCRVAAEHWEHRCYERATLYLQQSIILFQRTGRFPKRRLQLEETVNFLLPYRILDLVSCDITNQTKRKNNFTLIVDLLFNSQKSRSLGVSLFNQKVCQPFFLQIFQYITIQEQLTLFNYWEHHKSISAIFLSFYTQLAIGFSRQKPELILSALLGLFTLNKPNSADNINSVYCYLQLLLGDVNQAEINFLQQQKVLDQIKHLNLPNQRDHLLNILFKYTAEWLESEVLMGYRDFKIKLKLKDWFTVNKVQEYIEKIEYKRSYFYKLISDKHNNNNFNLYLNHKKNDYGEIKSFNRSIAYLKKNIFNNKKICIRSKSIRPEFDKRYQNNQINQYQNLINPKEYLTSKRSRVYWFKNLLLFQSIGITFIITLLVFFFRFTKFLPLYCIILPKRKVSCIQLNNNQKITQISDYLLNFPKLKINLNNSSFPVIDLYPSCSEMNNLITVWLKAKTTEASIEELKKITNHLVIDDLVNYIEGEQYKNKIHGSHSNIYAKVISLTILAKESTGLQVKALIKYKDQRLQKDHISGQIFTVEYLLHYKNGLWKLYNYVNMSFS